MLVGHKLLLYVPGKKINTNIFLPNTNRCNWCALVCFIVGIAVALVVIRELDVALYLLISSSNSTFQHLFIYGI